MKITLQWEAQLRQIAGGSERQIEVPDGLSVCAALQQALANDDGALRERILTPAGEVQASLLLFINEVTVAADAAGDCVLNEGDTVLLLPPISGG